MATQIGIHVMQRDMTMIQANSDALNVNNQPLNLDTISAQPHLEYL